MKKRAEYTLIELTVTLSIIFILMAILLPALNNVRQTVEQNTCKNNLKELGGAFHLFVADNDNYMPYDKGSKWFAYNKMGGYFGHTLNSTNQLDKGCDVAICPSASGLALSQSPWNANAYLSAGYGMNMEMAGTWTEPRKITYIEFDPSVEATIVDGMSNNWHAGYSNEFPFHRDSEPDWISKWSGSANGSLWNYSKERHKEFTNVLFLDGHVSHFTDLKEANTDGILEWRLIKWNW